MKFLEEKNLDKSSSIGITNLLSNITTREGSHKGGWSRLLKCQLKNSGFNHVKILDNKDRLQDFDIIIFDLGAEFSGALNMFGGLDEKVFSRLEQIKSFNGQIFSWRHELPSVTVLEGRRTNVSTCEAFKSTEVSYLGSIQEVLAKGESFQHAYRTSSLLIGDSHTPSVWTPELMIERRDGRTLDGMIKNNTLKKYLDSSIDTLQVHCSSIDVRHHWMRTEDPEQTAAGSVIDLVGQIHSIEPELKNVILTKTMGIENESRELPKTGYFKGTPFFGSWEERNRLRMIFNEVVEDYTRGCPGWSHVAFPEYFFDNGELRFDVMERPQSVHLSPEHYRWDLDKNQLRWTEAHDVGRQTHYAALGLIGKIEKEMYGS